MGVRWYGGQVRREVRSKAARKLDAAAREVARETKTLLGTPGTGKRESASRRVRKWIAYEKASVDVAWKRTKTTYKLGRGGRLKKQRLVWTGKMRRYRKGSKLLGAARSTAGQPPRKQTGRLRASIRVTEKGQLVRKVGTHVFYGKILEPTHPFLLPALAKSRATIVRLF